MLNAEQQVGSHVRIQRGIAGPDPLDNHKFYGVLYKLAFRPPPPGKKVGPPWKMLDPHLENVGPPLKPWNIIVFFEINHSNLVDITGTIAHCALK